MENEKLELISSMEFEEDAPLYKIIDFVNKSLKDKNIIVGLSKNHNKIVISIYQT
ncbi:hypothetical protein Csac_1884 [Caldicellulosiruptor saccharolyticus DSM 8903]|uniref:DUF4264 domain-containing protein n=1 Tax=Caldicellulosiruptor saccharolyticus (strain ATCC 43494 / DSM 8903 / Tp8T 6331) TaxID=351627 RepID=A4XKN4_CALS8|nr:DUF4264 family protein [Caldicellulosiruptor saccharolyticus]ABP67469.1 hypothetical protein Csac_1884 [Caldicellulosiruptor saccharolyticus DSM 8903]